MSMGKEDVGKKIRACSGELKRKWTDRQKNLSRLDNTFIVSDTSHLGFTVFLGCCVAVIEQTDRRLMSLLNNRSIVSDTSSWLDCPLAPGSSRRTENLSRLAHSFLPSDTSSAVDWSTLYIPRWDMGRKTQASLVRMEKRVDGQADRNLISAG